jgi:hypothetical protein
MNFGVQVLWDVTVLLEEEGAKHFRGTKCLDVAVFRGPHSNSVTSQRPAVYSYRGVTSSHILLTVTCKKTDPFQLLNSTNG